MNRRHWLQSLLAAALAPSAFLAWAQTAWPTKAIKWVNPFPAGGGTDVFARPMAAKIGMSLGQSVYIENLGGAAGTVGAGVASKAVLMLITARKIYPGTKIYRHIPWGYRMPLYSGFSNKK